MENKSLGNRMDFAVSGFAGEIIDSIPSRAISGHHAEERVFTKA